MSVSKLLHRDIRSDLEAAISHNLEEQVFHWMGKTLPDELARAIAHDELTPEQASKVWGHCYVCYQCCKQALKDGTYFREGSCFYDL